MPPAKISYAPPEQPASGDPVAETACGNQLFQSKLRNPSLTEDVMPPTQTHALASASCGLAHDPHMPTGHRVTVPESELPSLAFSDLSSDDEDDVGYRCRLLGSDAPLNLTKRSVPWPPALLMPPSSNSGYIARQPINSLRNDGDKSLAATFYNRELPLSPMIESSEPLYWMPSSRELFENNPAAGSHSKPEKHLPNPTIRETGSDVSQRLSGTVAKSDAVAVVKVESGNCTTVRAVTAERLKENHDEGQEEPPITSDLAVDTLDIQAQTPNRQVRGGVPLKVWHKRSALFAAARSVDFDQEDFQIAATTSGDASFIHDEDQTGAIAARSPNSSPSSDSLINYSSELSDSDSLQAKFRERRMRNSIAVRKSRDNRKLLTDLNMTAATILESENHKLKEELRSLSREVTDLKEMIGKKKDTRNGTQIQGAN